MLIIFSYVGSVCRMSIRMSCFWPHLCPAASALLLCWFLGESSAWAQSDVSSFQLLRVFLESKTPEVRCLTANFSTTGAALVCGIRCETGSLSKTCFVLWYVLAWCRAQCCAGGCWRDGKVVGFLQDWWQSVKVMSHEFLLFFCRAEWGSALLSYW